MVTDGTRVEVNEVQSLGQSGRVVIEIDAILKQEIHTHCRENGINLKQWFLENIEKTLSSTQGGVPAQFYRKTSIFISHASEDKEDVVRPLASLLESAGHEIWYDEFQMTVGDSLRQKIDDGLSSADWGIVVLSNSFFKKFWTLYELNGLLAKEIDGKKVILPIWHGLRRAEILQYSPSLADKYALSTCEMSIEKIAEEISAALCINL